ncbi:uncharacterized protein LOC129587988 [Paramacrobiotus metropolitanus]|uniref:uncharacterized protein LOC129587988 n=1 Tax=Paramacrobiotus metropolitanus TaxID=2943436 RepID=UPI0024458393|nr:uncharacterized protein LOC129587988 [Paramacrobiotus metropolitanus]
MLQLSAVQAAIPFDQWAPRVPELLRRMLVEFFKCDCPLPAANGGVASGSGETRRFRQIGRIVAELECRLQQRTWLNRRTYRKAVLQKRPGTLLGLEEQWRLECQVAERIAETAGRPVDLHFRLTLLHNAVETERLCVFLAADESSTDLQNLIEFLRRFLRLGQSAELENGRDSAEDAAAAPAHRVD